MRLIELRVRDHVMDDSNTPSTRFTESGGFTMVLEQGIVTLAGKTIKDGRMVPVSNVAFMVPAPAEKKK